MSWHALTRHGGGGAIALSALLLQAAAAAGTAGPVEVSCPDTPTYQERSFRYFRCSIPWHESIDPYGKSYEWAYAFRSSMSEKKKARLLVRMHGSGGGSGAMGSFAPEHGYLEVRNQDGEVHGHRELWGLSGYPEGRVGNYTGERIAVTLDWLAKRYAKELDLDKGIILTGSSMGGQGAIQQTMILPDRWRERIAISNGFTGTSMPRKCCPRPHMGPDAGANTSTFDRVDFRIQSRDPVVQNIVFYHAWGTNDKLGLFDPEFVELVEKHRIGGAFVWHQGGHSWQERGVNLAVTRNEVTLDRPFPAITRSSGNYGRDKPRGHYNMGIHWDHARITDRSIPISYTATKDIGGDVPDQPQRITFSVTPRRMQLPEHVSWTFGEQAGTASKVDGLVTIDGLALESGQEKTLVISDAQRSSRGLEPAVPRRASARLPAIAAPSRSGFVKVAATSSRARAGKQVPIIYSRVPRTRKVKTIVHQGVELTVRHPDLYDALPEVKRIRDNFSAPGQLVLLRDGVETVLYDCTTPCVPLDVMVSYDGKEAMFSVYRGTGYASSWHGSKELDTQLLKGGYEAQLHKVDLETFKVTPLAHTPKTFDTGPVYLPGGGIMYTSDKSGVYRPVMRRITPVREKMFRLWVRESETPLREHLVGQADMSGSQHPYVLSDGQVAVAQLMLSHMHPYRDTNGAFNWPGTINNLWWITSVDQKGGHWNSLYGAHVYLSALHFLGETSDNWVMATHYYRANNFGGGEIVMWKPEPIDIEGRGASERGEFLAPRTLKRLARWANAQDAAPKKHGGLFTGKLRDPTGLPGGQVLLTFARGRCAVVAGTIQSWEQSMANEPRGCDAGLYRTTRIPSESPDDLEVVVDSPQWHEFMPRVALPYRDIYGKDRPDRYTHEDQGSCRLKVASMESETTHLKGYHFGNFRACGMQGCELDGTRDADVTALRFWKVLPNTKAPRDFNDLDHIWGHRSELLGDVPLRADGSAYVELPCEVPYVMAGLDKDGLVVKRDQVVQSLRRGEQRECGGCHLHSRKGRPFAGTKADSQPPTVLAKASAVPEWNADIKPFLQKNCASCHAGHGWLMDYDKLVWDMKQEHALRKTAVNDRSDAKKYYLQRPNTSRYVSGDFARSSLLYWKCSGARRDNHKDAQFANDIDYGAEHPGFDCKLIADWIDSGAYRAK